MNPKLIVGFVMVLALGSAQQYSVSFMGVRVADVTLTVRDTIWHDQPATAVWFYSSSTSLADRIFAVDNQYLTILSASGNVVHFQKKTSQPGVVNEFATSWLNNSPVYPQSGAVISPGAHNIFTLLHSMAINPPAGALQVELDREGLKYRALATPREILGEYDLILTRVSDPKIMAEVEHTDIFTWAVFQPEAKRVISVDPQKQQLVGCEFRWGLIRLIARIEE